MILLTIFDFHTFRLLDILVAVQNELFYWRYCFFYFLTFRPLGGRYKWSLLLNIFNFFVFSTSCWEVKLIDFTGYIGLFWLFDFLTCFLEVKMIDFTEYIKFFRLLSILMNILIFFDFSTFRSLGAWSKWSIWLNILYFFDFSTFRPLCGG